MNEKEQNSLLVALAALRETADFIERSKGFGIPYVSTLQKFVKSKRIGDLRKPSESSKDLALKAWSNALETGRYDLLTARSRRILCTITEIATSKDFLNYIAKSSTPVTPLMIRALLATYHINWRQHSSHTSLEKILQKQISSYSGGNKTLGLWRQSLDHLVGDHAPSNVAKKMCNRLTEFQVVVEDLNIPVQVTPFGLAVIRAAIQLSCHEFSQSNSLLLNQWQFLTNYLLKFPGLGKPDRAHALAILIRTIARHQRNSAWDELKQQLKDLILKDPEFGDPRVNKPKWELFDTDAKQILIAWLSEEDLTFFFELIIRQDPHNRKPFWLRYVNKIRDSIVVIGEDDYYRYQRQLMELSSKGRRFGRGFGIPTSAFIMDFGNYIVVEFSEVNNACYIYSTREFQNLAYTRRSNEFDLKALKNRSVATHFQIHHVNWPSALRQVLDKLRIHAL